jgi:hypothetical protein
MIDGINALSSPLNQVGSTGDPSDPTQAQGVRRRHHRHPHGTGQAVAAQDQGLSPEEIQSALSQAVEAGTITQDQADAILQSIAQQSSPTETTGNVYSLNRNTGRVEGPPEIQAVAGKLGISVGELGSALRSGSTLADLAQEKGVSMQELNDAAASAAKAHLDRAVQAGRMDQGVEDSIIADIQSGRWLSHLLGPFGAEA